MLKTLAGMRLTFTITALLFLFPVAESACAAKRVAEYDIKAAYIVNFLMFVGPAEKNTTRKSGKSVGVTILGEDPFGRSFEPVAGRKIGKDRRKLVIRRHRGKLEELELKPYCRAVFIAESEDRKLGSILECLTGRPILTVSDIDGFARRGGMIEFTIRKKRVRWIINRNALKRAGLKASAQLLRNAAEIVYSADKGNSEAEAE
jgi:hypothetical protein